MKIIIQAGHEGRTSGSTGAPNEQSFNVDISNKVADELRKRGVEVKRVNADPTNIEIAGDWDLFLAIHYDADIYGKGGFFVDFPEPSTDGATEKSQRLAYLLRQEYGGTTKIVNHPERSNVNTRYYYMWKSISAKTPCVLIECGVGMHAPDDHSILHFNRDLVVQGIVKGLCLGLGVNYELPVATPTQDTPEPTTPPQTTPETTPTTPVVDNTEMISLREKIANAKTILYGKGFVWQKLNKLKLLLPKD